MANDIFLKLGDIKGESQDDRHRDEIEITSWAWGLSQLGSIAVGGGAGTSKAKFDDFTFVHRVDRASPNLMRLCTLGEHIREGVFTGRKAGKGPQEFFIIKLSDILITSIALHGTGDDAGNMTETITLQAARWDIEYKPQKADGSLDAGIHFKYDQKLSKEG